MSARRTRTGLGVIAGLIVGIFVLPLVAVALLSLSRSPGLEFYATPSDISFRWWAALARSPTWGTALVTSLTIATGSALVGLAMSLPLACRWRLARDRAAAAVLGAGGLILLLPPIVVALGMARLADITGLFDTSLGLSLAHAAIVLPVVSLILVSRFEARSTRPFETARALGAGPIAAAITWLSAEHRLTLAAAAAAGILTSMSEATITIFVTDTRVMTIAREALSGLTQGMSPTTFAAFAAWIVLASAAAVSLERIMDRRSSR